MRFLSVVGFKDCVETPTIFVSLTLHRVALMNFSARDYLLLVCVEHRRVTRGVSGLNNPTKRSKNKTQTINRKHFAPFRIERQQHIDVWLDCVYIDNGAR